MGDDDGGAPAHHLRERGLHFALGYGVQRRGGLVQDQDRRVLQQRSCDGHPLPLAAGEQHAVVADAGVQALRQGSRELLRVGPRQGGRDRVRRGAGQCAIGDVVGQRVVEQRHFLRDKRDLAAQAGEPIAREGLAIEQNPARRRFVEACD